MRDKIVIKEDGSRIECLILEVLLDIREILSPPPLYISNKDKKKEA